MQNSSKAWCAALQASEHAQSVAASALALSAYQAGADADEVDLDLVQGLLEHVCGEGSSRAPGAAPPAPGAVLVFLPGAQVQVPSSGFYLGFDAGCWHGPARVRAPGGAAHTAVGGLSWDRCKPSPSSALAAAG